MVLMTERRRDDEETTMWFKDAIAKALGDVIGKWASEAQGVVAEEFRGLIWREVRFGAARTSSVMSVLSHLQTFGTMLYQSGTRSRESSGEITPIRVVYRYQGHFVCVYRTETTLNLYHTKGLDFDKLCKLADATVIRRSVLWSGTTRKDSVEWNPRGLAVKDLHRGKEVLALETDLLRWLAGESVFRRAGLPHRRGWLLYGKPGNGKTSAIQQLAVAHNMSISIPTFARGHMYLHTSTICKSFILIEDIDNIFRGREPLNPDADFGNFLNAIDGVNDLDNCIVVITTNDLSAIDPAIGRPRDETQWNSLSTRPGRIDRCIYFDNPDHEARLGIAKKMLPDDEAAKLAGEGDGLSVAQFSAIVRERAMEVVSEMVGEGVGEVGKTGTGTGTMRVGQKRT
jgi:hypothetical protein